MSESSHHPNFWDLISPLKTHFKRYMYRTSFVGNIKTYKLYSIHKLSWGSFKGATANYV